MVPLINSQIGQAINQCGYFLFMGQYFFKNMQGAFHSDGGWAMAA
jgi:hypothetical protein